MWRRRKPIEWSREDSERLFDEGRLLPSDAILRRTNDAIEIGYHESLARSIMMALLMPAVPIAMVAIGAVCMLVLAGVLKPQAFSPLILVVIGLYLFTAVIAVLFSCVRWKSRTGDVSVRYEDGVLDCFGSRYEAVRPARLRLIFGISHDSGESRQQVTFYGHAMLETETNGVIHLYSWASGFFTRAPRTGRRFAQLLRIPVDECRIAKTDRLSNNFAADQFTRSMKM